MPEMPLHVRGVDEDTWRLFRVEAVRRGVPVGRLLTEVLRQWLEKEAGRAAPEPGQLERHEGN